MAVVRYAWFGIVRFFVNGVLRTVIWFVLVSTIGGVVVDMEANDNGEIGGVKSASLRSLNCDTELRIIQFFFKSKKILKNFFPGTIFCSKFSNVF